MFKSFIFIIFSLRAIGGAEKNLLTVTKQLKKMNIDYKILIQHAGIHDYFHQERIDGNIVYISELEKVMKIRSEFDNKDNLIVNVLPTVLENVSSLFIESSKMAMWHGDGALDNINTENTVEYYINLFKAQLEFDYLSVLCEGTAKVFRKAFPEIAEKIVVQYNMFEEVDQDSILGSAEKKIVWIGNYKIEKGVDHLIKIIPKLNLTEHTLDIYGRWGVKDREDFYSKIDKEFHDKCIIHGFENDINKIYENGKCLISTSISEGWPMVFGDAHQRGLPVVTFDSFVCVNDIVKDSINGYVIPSFEIDLFANKVNEILNKSIFDKGKIIDESHYFNVENRIYDLINLRKKEFRHEFKYEKYVVCFDNKMVFDLLNPFFCEFFKYLKSNNKVEIAIIQNFKLENREILKYCDKLLDYKLEKSETEEYLSNINNVETLIHLEDVTNQEMLNTISANMIDAVVYLHIISEFTDNNYGIVNEMLSTKNVNAFSLSDERSFRKAVSLYQSIYYMHLPFDMGIRSVDSGYLKGSMTNYPTVLFAVSNADKIDIINYISDNKYQGTVMIITEDCYCNYKEGMKNRENLLNRENIEDILTKNVKDIDLALVTMNHPWESIINSVFGLNLKPVESYDSNKIYENLLQRNNENKCIDLLKHLNGTKDKKNISKIRRELLDESF